MSKLVKLLRLGKKDIILVGTAHVSKKSVEDVKDTIKKEKPDIVAVELCEKRYEALKNKDRWKETEISKIIKENKTYLFLANLILANFQRKIGKTLGVEPGAEMLAAIDSAKKVKAKVELVDRDIQITFKRAFHLMGLWEKIKLVFSLIVDTFSSEVDEELVEKLKEDEDVLTEAINSLAKIAPTAKKVLLDERDSYIAGKISELKGKKIVAVVGAGHLQGISDKLGKGVDFKKLESVPRKWFKLRYLGYLIPVIFALLIGYSFYTHGAGVTLQMFLYWFLINGVLAAIGTALAFGHPLSVLSAFLAAPFTSLNPAMAAGWVAGYVEAVVRKPKVKDFEGLGKLDRIRDFWKNRVTRVLLVVVFANLGSTIGTFVALPYLFSLL